MSSSSVQDDLAKERDAKFKAWVQRKSVRDKAFEYLGKLNPSRATAEESLKEVAISLCAVDRLLGNDEDGNSTTKNVSRLDSVQDETSSKKSLTGKAGSGPVEMTMKKMWFRWTNENHTFESVTLSKADQDSFSGAVKEYMDFERDEMGKPRPDSRCWLPSLKYTFPGVPKPGEKPKPLTNDQKQQNIVFARECRKLWREALSDLRQRVMDGVIKLEKKKMEEREGNRKNSESERKSKESNDKSSADGPGASGGGNTTRYETAILNELSLKRLKEWVEEDEDKLLEREKEKIQEKNDEAKKMHEQFVRKKDGLRIRLPDPSELPRPVIPRMDYANRADAPVRPKSNVCAKSTVDMLAHTGAKYAYAQSKGRWVNMGDHRVYIEGDLDRSRKKLLEMGVVYKENFDEEEGSKFHMDTYSTEKRENAALREKREREEKTKENSAKAFDDWVQLKSVRDQAVKRLALLTPPVLCVSSRDLGLGSLGGEAKSVRANGKGGMDEGVEFVIEVGRALKKVDRTLLKDWAMWCERVQGPRLQRGDPDWVASSHLEDKEPSSLFTPNVVAALWESFEPVACDIHSASHSQARDTFMKLANRPGLDFKAVFNDFADRTLSRKVNRIVEKEGRMSHDDQAEFAAKVRADLKADLRLSKEEMTTLLVEMGVSLKSHQLRVLVDAFDADGDGVVTLNEFLSFTGPKRDKHSGAMQAMSSAKCCWLTTCKVTGMSNAYAVSNLTKQAQRDLDRGVLRTQTQSQSQILSSSHLRNESRSKSASDRNRDKGVYGDEWDEEDVGNMSVSSSASNIAGRMVIREIKNGEKRMCIELRERVRREDMLTKLGAINAAGHCEAKDDGDGNDDNYDDDFEDGEKGVTREEEVKSCGACDWSLESRRKGLRYLNEVTYEAQQEQHLKGLLSNGTVPNVPKLWEGSASTNNNNGNNGGTKWQGVKTSNALRASQRMESSQQSSPSEIMIHWGAAKGDSVSFFSLEFAGPSTGATRALKYKEIFRDPEDASPESEFRYARLIEGLLPGTSYAFRVRGFNGFGPGEYAYKIFTTRPAAPSCPRITCTASDAVTLRWVFSASFFKHMDDLKLIFQLADPDSSGGVTRDELAAVLDESGSAACSPELKSFLQKVAVKVGLDIAQGYGALFDFIEVDDNGTISWEEFESFFMSAGWATSSSVAGSVRASMNSFVTTAAENRIKTSDASSGLTYVVERCKNEFLGEYVEEVRTCAGQTIVHRLEPGVSYRFRVYALNIDGVSGPPSPSVVVHAMLETPLAPCVVVKSLGCRGVSLTWKKREQVVSSSRDKLTVQKMLGDWAGTHGEDDGGVSIETAFARYDRDRSGTIELEELELLLKDLGVEASEERIRDAMTTFDSNQDGVISFEEFGVWWRRDEVSYTIKRSEPITAVDVINDRIDIRSSTTSLSVTSEKARTRAQSALRSSRESQRDGERDRESQMDDDRSINSAHSLAQSITPSVRSSSAARGRPSSATSTARDKDKERIQAVQKKRVIQVAMPVVSYRGPQTKCDIAGLEPNRLYHFKLRYSGPRSHSILSAPLALMTAPLAPPCPPLLVTLEATTVRIKLYAPEFGGFKFLLQLKALTSFPGNPLRGIEIGRIGGSSSGSGAGAPNPGVSSVIGGVAGNRDITSGEWVSVYFGMETLFTCTTMHTDAAYHCRYFAVNCQGAVSEPSPVQSFSTLHRDDNSSLLTHRNAEHFFTIECTGDICVGDTVLMTERLFSKPQRDESSASTGSRIIGGGFGSKGANTAGQGNGLKSSMRLNMNATDRSLMSVSSSGGTPAPGVFIGERTIAAYVVRDNYRSSRDEIHAIGTSPKDLRRFGKYRRLWLEVVWQKSSNEACRRYELKKGAVIERQQSHLEQFEVFRCPWRTEKCRKPLCEEWAANSESFVQIDC